MLLFVGGNRVRKGKVATLKSRETRLRKGRKRREGDEEKGEKDSQRQTENCQQTAFTIVTSKTRPYPGYTVFCLRFCYPPLSTLRTRFLTFLFQQLRRPYTGSGSTRTASKSNRNYSRFSPNPLRGTKGPATKSESCFEYFIVFHPMHPNPGDPVSALRLSRTSRTRRRKKNPPRCVFLLLRIPPSTDLLHAIQTSVIPRIFYAANVDKSLFNRYTYLTRNISYVKFRYSVANPILNHIPRQIFCFININHFASSLLLPGICKAPLATVLLAPQIFMKGWKSCSRRLDLSLSLFFGLPRDSSLPKFLDSPFRNSGTVGGDIL
ncbi:hypothetical protein ALC60_03696 [Trachymyrmex zeteki]|uniref:Uncharacterized protein n=1 Tax=Mycetomoellerius zeteki TaxID=64791 RepID=A0A151XAJ2_9HYME|nr:hypothetical protein ALC60_03696 [Trachymyrmex zeteki]